MHIGEDTLSLTRLTLDLGPAYLDMVDEFRAHGEGYPYNNIPLARENMATFVRELQEEEQGGLPPGIVPQTTYVLVEQGTRVVGEIRFRPSTRPPYGIGRDHIGYNVRPSARQQGYGTSMLSGVLVEARRLGLPGVGLTIERANVPSVRMIERQGGRLERRDPDPDTGESAALYWIPLE